MAPTEGFPTERTAPCEEWTQGRNGPVFAPARPSLGAAGGERDPQISVQQSEAVKLPSSAAGSLLQGEPSSSHS